MVSGQNTSLLILSKSLILLPEFMFLKFDSELPAFADYYRQLQDADKAFAKQCMTHWLLFLRGPPNRPNEDPSGLLQVPIGSVDGCCPLCPLYESCVVCTVFVADHLPFLGNVRNRRLTISHDDGHKLRFRRGR